MHYTIIGAEANLAARLQSIAEPGQIVISYETYAFVRDIAIAQALAPITMKGISREVIPYAVGGILDPENKSIRVFSEHLTGADFYLNANMIGASDATHLRKVLQDALMPRVLDARMRPFMATPKAGSAWITGGNCDYRIVRGSSWRSSPVKPPLREPNWVTSESRVFSLFFRVGQTLLAP